MLAAPKYEIGHMTLTTPLYGQSDIRRIELAYLHKTVSNSKYMIRA